MIASARDFSKANHKSATISTINTIKEQMALDLLWWLRDACVELVFEGLHIDVLSFLVYLGYFYQKHLDRFLLSAVHRGSANIN
jgi:hypothetical protein